MKQDQPRWKLSGGYMEEIIVFKILHIKISQVIRLYIILWDFFKLSILLLRIIHIVTYFDFCMIFPIVNRSQCIWNIFEYKNWSKIFLIHLKIQSKNIFLFPPDFSYPDFFHSSPQFCPLPPRSPLSPPSVPWSGSSSQWSLIRTLMFQLDSNWIGS